MAITGSATTEIDAPIAEVYEIAADAAGAGRWQKEIKSAEALETNAAGEQTLVHIEADAKVTTLGSDMRFTYDAPTGLQWEQVKGPVKSLHGSWVFEDLGDGRTKATYEMEVDLGRKLGLMIRGPLVDAVRKSLVESMPGKLKKFVESQPDD